MVSARDDCPFCQIVQGDGLDAREVYRNEHVVAFVPLEPATLGHTLVVPRHHIPDIWSLDRETADHLTQATLQLSNAVRRATQPEGLSIIQSNGEVAAQTVFHLHVHIVPRWSGDPVGGIWPPETSYPEAEKHQVWKRLRRECQKAQAMTQSSAKITVAPDDRRKHLDFIQSVVTRMSSASSTAKGWLLPVVTVAYGFALTEKAESVALLGVVAVLLFALLDANYLRQEKAYRRLYDAVARETRDVPLFCLDPSNADDPGPPAVTLWSKAMRRLQKWVPSRGVWLSWSIAPFYGGLIITGILVFLTAR